MSEPTPVIAVKGLTKHYGGVKALTDAEFRLNPGEHVAIVGDNGAGKSTFVRLITGVEQPSRGDILMDGQAVAFDSPLDAREQGVETVFQNLALAEDLDVPANIFMGREITRLNLGPLSILNHRAMRAQSVEMLSTTGVKIQDLSEPMRGMSGGQRQRVVIAMAIALKPKLLIADEPTTALDVTTQAQILDLLRDLVREYGMGLMIITHDLAVVANFADRIVVISGGVIAAEGSAADLADQVKLHTRISWDAADAPSEAVPAPFRSLLVTSASEISIETTEVTEVVHALSSWATPAFLLPFSSSFW